MADPLHLPPGARAVLTGPDFLARALATRERDPQRRWMLLQDEETRRSYVTDVLEHEAEPDRQAIWLLGQPRKVRESYIAGVIDVTR